MASKVISYDVESTGLSTYMGDYMFSFSTCTKQGETSVHRIDGPKLRRIRNRKVLNKIWSNKALAKSAHNMKFDLAFTEKELGRSLSGNAIHDTSIMSHILQNHHPSHRLKDLAWELAGVPKDDENVVKKYATGGANYQSVPEHLMDKYQHRDAERGMLLQLFFHPRILASKAYREIYNMELDLIWTTLRIEQRGIMLSVPKCKNLIAHLEEEVKGALDELESAVGRPFNPDKSIELRRLLFNELGLPVLKRTKKTKVPSTEKEVLMELNEKTKNPLLNLIVKYRSYSRGMKILAGYLDCSDEDGIIHSDIHTNGTITGRESSRNPNLQNVSKTGVHLNPFPIPSRKCFRPRPGYVNFHFDYSGEELRLLTHESGDKKMIDIFLKGKDPHAVSAEIFFGSRFRNANKKAAKTLRDASKNANYAIPYGCNFTRLAEILNISHQEARSGLEAFKTEYPKLYALNKTTSDEVRDNGYVETVFGRRLHLARNKPYMGVNYRIQGGGGGVIKRAQNSVSGYLKDATGNEVRIIMPIHDELIIEYPRKRLKDKNDILPVIVKKMTDFPQLKVPLEVEVKVSTSDWENLKEVKV